MYDVLCIILCWYDDVEEAHGKKIHYPITSPTSSLWFVAAVCAEMSKAVCQHSLD